MLRKVLIGCAAAAAIASPAIAGELDVAKAAVRANLRDPASARFSDMRERKGAVCGFVAARNGFGGYGEPMLFVYLTAERAAYVIDPRSNNGPIWNAKAIGAYKGHCQG